MGITGFKWVLLGFTGFYWVLLGSTGFYLVLLGFTGFYWILLRFTGFYWVLLGFTGFYWVLLGFTGFYWCGVVCKPPTDVGGLVNGLQVHLNIVGGNEGGVFRVNPTSGVLYTARPLDAEQRAEYVLTISAVDQDGAPGATRKQSSAKVRFDQFYRVLPSFT